MNDDSFKKEPLFPSSKMSPFLRSDLKEVPNSWEILGPNFIGVGTIKAGTSWWYSLLLAHPQIVPNRLNMKELRYFVHFGYHRLTRKQRNTYLKAFATPPGCSCGEWSPIYLSYPLCLRNISKTAPDTKILVILRNPIHRTISFLNEAAYGTSAYHFNADQLDMLNHFSIYPNAVLSSLYADNLKRLFRLFKKEQVLILQYEKCCRSPDEEIARTYRFLEVDDRFTPVQVKERVNQKKYLVSKLKHNELALLRDYFCEDVRKTILVCPEIDLSLWTEFSDLKP